MRATTRMWWPRYVAIAGLGSYLGAAVTGLIAVFSDPTVTTDANWLGALPLTLPLGAAIGVAVARGTRQWLARQRRHRRLWVGAAAGAVAFPAVLAAGHSPATAEVAVPCMAIGSIGILAIYRRGLPGRGD